MKELFRKDIIFRITSLLLALLMWFYVTNLENPRIEKSFTVPISYYGLKEELILGEKPSNVDIKLKGSFSVLNTLSAKDIKATVDLTKAKLGEGNYPIDLIPPAGTEITYMKNASVLLNIDTIIEKQMPIRVKIENTVAQGYSSFDPILDPSQVNVKGPQSIISTIESAQVTLDLNKATDNLTLRPTVYMVDKKGSIVNSSDLEISPQTVQAYVPVQNIPTKTVPIKSNLTGKPKDGWVVSRIVIEPETIKIIGSYDLLMAVEQLNTKAINISGIHENMSTQVALETPQGISVLYQPTVKVLIQVEETPITKSFSQVSLSTINTPVGKKSTLNPEHIEVTVKGPRKEIEALTAEDIKAVVDLAELDSGSHQIEAKIELPSNLQFIKANPVSVEVIIVDA